MAKFQTHVAGVTYYDIDYSKIKKTSEVRLIPEPTNRYDDAAIRVEINKKAVGYIKRGFNKTLISEMQRGSEVSARVRSVVGGGEGMNYGIVLDVVVDDGQAKLRGGSHLGEVKRKASREITVSRSYVSLEKTPEDADLWIAFLEKKRKILSPAAFPTEPDYRSEYRKKTSWLARVFSDGFEQFRSDRKNEYLRQVEAAKARNQERDRLIEAYSAEKKLAGREFKEFASKSKVRSILSQIRASPSRSSNEPSPFVTVYERTLFSEIQRYVPFSFQQVKIDDKNIDILCITEWAPYVWAIEVDGGVHQRERKIASDRVLESHLHQLGVSLIRVPNSIVSEDVQSCCKKILEILKTGSSS